tara:strand:+ start:136 stop:564 length:429 start_codon:yes stop_codon:yes gene_type:complete
MPKSKLHKKKLNREFLHLQEKYVNRNYAKYYGLALRDMVKYTDLTKAELEFLVYAYDLEFFEITWISASYGQSRKKLYERIILPLKKKGYLQEYLGVGKNAEDVDVYFGIRRNAQKLSVSHKGRHNVQRLYRKCEGEEEIRY